MKYNQKIWSSLDELKYYANLYLDLKPQFGRYNYDDLKDYVPEITRTMFGSLSGMGVKKLKTIANIPEIPDS